MLPGKQFAPEDVLRVLRRRFWLLLVPMAIGGAALAVIGRVLPDRYAATAILLVVKPKVTIEGNETSRFTDRLRTMAEQILSRTRLENIIREQDLYLEERQKELMQDIVESMRDDVQVDPARTADTFTVSYYGSEPRKVRDVTNKLAELFIRENTRERSTQAAQQTQFFASELKAAETALNAADAKREAFRRTNWAQLPEQVSSNQSALGNVQTQMRTSSEALNRAELRKRDLEAELKALENAAPVAPEAAPLTMGADGSLPAGSTEAQLRVLRDFIASKRASWSDNHPDMIRLRQVESDLEKKLQAELLTRPISQPAAVPPQERLRLARIGEIGNEIVLQDRIIQQEKAELGRLSGQAGEYQRRIEGVPALESEWLALNRDYDMLSTKYKELLGKVESARMQENVESRQIGEQFQLIDSAVLPQRPVSPNRPLLTGMGLAAGAGLGLLVVLLLEYRDSSFKTDQEVTRLLSLPVLAVVPIMQSDEDRRRARRRQWLVAVGCSATVLGSAAVMAYMFLG
jgi:polysaccharide chain length determinant protein (PEP-CTERM system associated)